MRLRLAIAATREHGTRVCARAALLWALLALAGLCAGPARADDGKPSGYEELLLETRVNGLPPAVTLLVLRDAQQRLWLPGEAFRDFRMRLPETVLEFDGEEYRKLHGQTGLSATLDMSRLTLEIEAAPEWFQQNMVDGGASRQLLPPKVDPGAFLNYDLDATHAGSETTGGALLELGAFGGWGVLLTSMVARSGRDYGDNPVRLDTTWTRDMPGRRASLRVGDAIGGASAWGRPVRFGGVQLATNFATQPGFVSFPLPTLQGEAALPSTLDLYVNGIRRMTSEVPTGPFEIPDLPVVTGQGDVQLVVTDVLGRQQILTDRFYVSGRMLRPGLHQFSYEAGAERENYSLDSFDYGRGFATGTHRYGFSDHFTGESRLEALSGQVTGGLGGALLLQGLGVVYAAVAGSHADGGNGGQLTLGLERSTPTLGFGFNLQMASAEFRQLGLAEDQLAARSRAQAWLSLPFGQAGSLSLNYVRRDERNPELGLFQSLGANYNVNLGGFAYLTLFASRIWGDEDDRILGFSLTHLYGERSTASLGAQTSRDSDQWTAQVRKSLPQGTGLGYYARAGGWDLRRLDAGISAQNDYGTWALESSRANGDSGLRASASGGLSWLGHGAYLSRRMDSSFAVVEVGDFEGVRVYADNQHVATTDADGRALLPRLRAYEENPLRIEVGDLPIDARVDQVEYRAVPWYRSGLVVEFAVARSRSATFRLLRPVGEPVPAGSMIHAGGGLRFPVGMDGAAFVTGVDDGTPLSARWNGTRCDFTLAWPDTEDPLPELGEITCAESRR